MEKLYRKKENGRYESVGYSAPNLHDGIWLVSSTLSSKSTTSLIYKIGDIPKADLQLHASLQKHSDKLSLYLSKLKDSGSKEFLEAKELCGGYVRDKLEIHNWSNADVVSMLLRELAKIMQDETT